MKPLLLFLSAISFFWSRAEAAEDDDQFKMVILFGSPGSGKGTLAQHLVLEKGYQHVSVGDLLREEVSKGTEIGQKYKAQILEGYSLLPSEVIETIMKERVHQSISNKVSLVIDGFPRLQAQANLLNSIFKDHNMNHRVHFIHLITSSEIAIERTLGRQTCLTCHQIYHLTFLPPAKVDTCDKCASKLFHRSSDNLESIKKRIELFNNTVKEVILSYKTSGVLREIDGNQSISETINSLENLLS